MDSCLPSCSCDGYEGITTADLDRYTDKIENVLHDEKGRKFFRNFMITSKMKDGRKALNLWEHNERLLNSSPDEISKKRQFLADLEALIDKAEDVEELDFAIMERLTVSQEAGDVGEIKNVLKLLKNEIHKCMKREYNAFRMHFIPKK